MLQSVILKNSYRSSARKCMDDCQTLIDVNRYVFIPLLFILLLEKMMMSIDTES